VGTAALGARGREVFLAETGEKVLLGIVWRRDHTLCPTGTPSTNNLSKYLIYIMYITAYANTLLYLYVYSILT
jgi:hypothetical protein